MPRFHALAAPMLIATLLLLGSSKAAPPAVDEASAQAAITQMANAFVEAFQKGDAKLLGTFWAPDADYRGLDGRLIRGRDAIVADYVELFKENKGLSLRIEVHSLRFPTPDTAIEDGVTSVLGPEGSLPNRARYTNTLVQRDGKWLLMSVRESPYVPPSHAEHLQDLAWVIGEWVEEKKDPGPRGHIVLDWTPDLNFIVGQRAVIVGDALLHTGSERIGWDPSTKRIRSWNFESDGGFGEGRWSHDGDAWTIKSTSTLSSGSRLQSSTVIKRVDANTISWQTTNQVVDGKPLPDSPVVTMKRVS